jgi:acyl carrier protein
VSSAVEALLGGGKNADLDESLSALGADSKKALELHSQLERTTGLALPATLAYDYPSIKTLTAYLQTFFVAKV